MTGVAVVPATAADRPVIARLIQLYLHDMTEFLPFAIGRDGLFAYDYLDRFWQHPYLIEAADELAGFALVIDHCPVTGASPCWFMAEFFVLRAHRGRGVGRAAFTAIVERHRGPWHVGVVARNAAAAAFWSAAAGPLAGEPKPRSFDGEDWLVYAVPGIGL